MLLLFWFHITESFCITLTLPKECYKKNHDPWLSANYHSSRRQGGKTKDLQEAVSSLSSPLVRARVHKMTMVAAETRAKITERMHRLLTLQISPIPAASRELRSLIDRSRLTQSDHITFLWQLKYWCDAVTIIEPGPSLRFHAEWQRLPTFNCLSTHFRIGMVGLEMVDKEEAADKIEQLAMTYCRLFSSQLRIHMCMT